MAWIESHQALARHPKTIRFAHRLGESVPSAIGRLHLLWWWALEYAENGDLGEYQDSEIAFAMMWDGDPTLLIDALKASGFLDPDRQIHDWWDYAGRLVDQRRANAHRMRETRAAHVQEMCDTRTGATVPNSTVPNPTEHDTTNVVTIACSDNITTTTPKPVPKAKVKQPKDPPVYSEHVLFVCQCFERVPGRLTAFHRDLIDKTVAETGLEAFQAAVKWKAGNDGKYNLNAIVTTARKIAKEGNNGRAKPNQSGIITDRAEAEAYARDHGGNLPDGWKYRIDDEKLVPFQAGGATVRALQGRGLATGTTTDSALQPNGGV